jgi:mono/diheme cytochrome c family protein
MRRSSAMLGLCLMSVAAAFSVVALLRAATSTTAELPVSVLRATAVVTHAGPAAPLPASYTSSGFYAGEKDLDPSERAGREIWYKATAGNGRFHTYVFQQRLGVLIDWYRVLRSDARPDRFKAWGLINDPDCCTPGSPGCAAKSADDTYGFDWCPGDETLLSFVGKTGYRDPACDFKDAPSPQDPGGSRDRQDACDLAFGTSTGALGLRKFPNPRFDAEKWRALNGGRAGTWEGYDKKLSADKGRADSKVSHLLDGSAEPPFYVGMACGACHIAFNPLKPPKDPTNPKWENIIGAVGNQYARFSEIMASGMPTDSPEWQIFTHARPGTVDTSAVPNDQVHNPGTMNAILNLKQRPTFPDEVVVKWRRVASCPADAGDESCWCEPGKNGKCWRRSSQKTEVNHILKGGEDSIGAAEAVQRVYFNIGSCSETCWVNHLTDLRQLDPYQRNYGQTPFDIGQCRRECPNFRAIEDRLEDVVHFLMSREARAADLSEAKGIKPDDLRDQLEKEYGPRAVDRGRVVFAANCARCHSSQAEPFQNVDFRKAGPEPSLRLDWMGNDRPTPVSEVGTFECRALHSNHMEGHVWQEYGSETLRSRPPDPNLRDSGGGRGYYRNISLLSVWAFAPFMHNNAIGPELCGQPANKDNDFYHSPWVDENGQALDPAKAPPCMPYDPSVNGRLQVYKASMEALLNPKTRGRKVSVLDEPIRIDVGPRTVDGEKEKKIFGLRLEFPAGLPASYFGNFQHKSFFRDLVLAKTDPAALKSQLVQRYGPGKGEQMAIELGQMADELLKNPDGLLQVVRPRLDTINQLYLSCGASSEDDGHRFGESLPTEDKKALIAFLATL